MAVRLFLLVYYVGLLVTCVSRVKVRREGRSLVVTLPKELVACRKIREGEVIEIHVSKIRKDGFGILKGMKPFNARDELVSHE